MLQLVDFRKDYLSNKIIKDLFYQQVNYLATQNEILFENVFIDGTKIEANANRYSFVWKKAVLKNEEKMFEKILALVETINLKELNKFSVQKETIIDDIDVILRWLTSEKEKKH